MAALTKAQWTALARLAVVELLEAEHAAVGMEIDAKIADSPHPSVGLVINPHHISTAYRQLLGEGVIAEEEASARGDRTLSTVYLPGRRNRTAVATASRRKRLLLSRYLG